MAVAYLNSQCNPGELDWRPEGFPYLGLFPASLMGVNEEKEKKEKNQTSS